MENPASDSSFPQDECKQHVGLALIESIQLQPFTLAIYNKAIGRYKKEKK
jgi:hypothetical protein